jgi:hypothetical protein
LFLALGASLRDKIGGRTIAKSIVCQELTVVADEPVGREPVRILARIGRTSQPSGLGEVDVNGVVKVNGIVNANQYALQGVPIFPTFQVTPRTTSPVRSAPGDKPAASTSNDENRTRPGDGSKNSPPASEAANTAAPKN